MTAMENFSSWVMEKKNQVTDVISRGVGANITPNNPKAILEKKPKNPLPTKIDFDVKEFLEGPMQEGDGFMFMEPTKQATFHYVSIADNRQGRLVFLNPINGEPVRLYYDSNGRLSFTKKGKATEGPVQPDRIDKVFHIGDNDPNIVDRVAQNLVITASIAASMEGGEHRVNGIVLHGMIEKDGRKIYVPELEENIRRIEQARRDGKIYDDEAELMKEKSKLQFQLADNWEEQVRMGRQTGGNGYSKERLDFITQLLDDVENLRDEMEQIYTGAWRANSRKFVSGKKVGVSDLTTIGKNSQAAQRQRIASQYHRETDWGFGSVDVENTEYHSAVKIVDNFAECLKLDNPAPESIHNYITGYWRQPEYNFKGHYWYSRQPEKASDRKMTVPGGLIKLVGKLGLSKENSEYMVSLLKSFLAEYSSTYNALLIELRDKEEEAKKKGAEGKKRRRPKSKKSASKSSKKPRVEGEEPKPKTYRDALVKPKEPIKKEGGEEPKKAPKRKPNGGLNPHPEPICNLCKHVYGPKHRCILNCRFGDKCKYCAPKIIQPSTTNQLVAANEANKQGPAQSKGRTVEYDGYFWRLYDADNKFLGAVSCQILDVDGSSSVYVIGNTHNLKNASYFLKGNQRVALPPISKMIIFRHHADMAGYRVGDCKITDYHPIGTIKISHVDEDRVCMLQSFDPSLLDKTGRPAFKVAAGKYRTAKEDQEVRHTFNTDHCYCGSLLIDESAGRVLAVHWLDKERGAVKRSKFPNAAWLVNPLN
jgi:hypothetical protein